MSRAGAIVLASLAACRLDTSGTGAPSNMLGTLDSSGGDDAPLDTSTDDTASTSTTTLGDASADSTHEGSTGADPSGEPSESSSSSIADESSSGGIDECADPPFFAVQVPADQALLVPPMTLDAVANGAPYVYSPTEDMGTATFTFDVPCPDEYFFHAFVYDAVPGPIDLAFQDNGADSYAITVGGGATATWQYGCQTSGSLLPPVWQWQPVMDNFGCIIADDKVIAPLLAGSHSIAFRNLEPGTNDVDTPGSAAAIAVLVVTNDPNHVP